MRKFAVNIHETADVRSNQIGQGTTVWQFCVVLPEAQIGRDCNLNAHCFVESDVVLGDRVTVKSGVYLWNGVRLENDVFVGPNVTFTNDRFPRSKTRPKQFITTIVRQGASIGAGSTILCGVTIGKRAMIGAGSMVTKNVPDGELWYGNPATRRGVVPDPDPSAPV